MLNAYITATLQRNRATRSEPQREALLSKNTSCGRLGRPKQEMEFPKQKWYHGLLKCQ